MKLDDLVAFVKATIDVKSTELVLRPGTAVVTTPLTLLVSLDEQGAVYDSAPSSCWAARRRRSSRAAAARCPMAEVYTYGGTVELPYIFEHRRARLHSVLSLGFSAWRVRCRCNPVVSRAPCGCAECRAESRVSCRDRVLINMHSLKSHTPLRSNARRGFSLELIPTAWPARRLRLYSSSTAAGTDVITASSVGAAAPPSRWLFETVEEAARWLVA